MTNRNKYEDISIPENISEIINKSEKRGKRYKRFQTAKKCSAIVFVCLIFTITVNVPAVSAALKDMPVIGKLVDVFQINKGGSITDGVLISTDSKEDIIKINFNLSENQLTTAPSYTVNKKVGPNRIVFDFSGVRNFDYNKLQKDILSSPYIKDVYRNIVLDDSAISFVVELKENVDYSISEYKEPGYMELKLFNKNEEEPKNVYFIRSKPMENGEPLAMIAEMYLDEDATVVKTKNGLYSVSIGEYSSKEEADKALETLKNREDYNDELYVDSCMSNENPK